MLSVSEHDFTSTTQSDTPEQSTHQRWRCQQPDAWFSLQQGIEGALARMDVKRAHEAVTRSGMQHFQMRQSLLEVVHSCSCREIHLFGDELDSRQEVGLLVQCESVGRFDFRCLTQLRRRVGQTAAETHCAVTLPMPAASISELGESECQDGTFRSQKRMKTH